MSGRIVTLCSKPHSELDIRHLADLALRKAGALGRLPTPIDDLIAAAGIRDEADPRGLQEQFLASLAESVRDSWQALFQKIRGIADLRERVVYVPASTLPRTLFVKGHELGHQVMPWQQLNSIYQDDDFSLSSETQELFDIEANYFSAEVIFQGDDFRTRALDCYPSFAAVFLLADDHGASKHATLRRFVEVHDEILAAVHYWPSQYVLDQQGLPVLRLGKVIASNKFETKYSDLHLSETLNPEHPWAKARNSAEVAEGEITLSCGPSSNRFQWQAWWNGYCLFVLLRRPPALSLVSRIISDRVSS